MGTDLSKQQFAKNIAINLLSFALAVVSGFFLTPFLIGKLGVAAYGLVPLTNNLVNFLGVVTVVLSSSVSRFVTLEVGREQYERANTILSTSVWASLAMAVVALLVGGIAALRPELFMAIPDGYHRDAALLLLLASASFAVTLLQTPFGAATFCANRIDLSAWLAVATRATQIVVGVGLVATIYSRPGAMVIGSLAAAIAGVIVSVYFWRRLMPWSRIELRIDPAILREQATFGVWNAVNLVGSILYLQIDLLVVNRLLGPQAGGEYAAIAQWSILIRGLGGTVSAVFAPSIMHHHAREDSAGVIRYAKWSIRTLGLFLSLPIGLICGLARPLLGRWLGADFSHLAPLLGLMIFHLGVNIAVYPLFTVQAALNKVRVPAIVTCGMGAANAALAVALTPALGLYGVALAGAVMLTAKNVIFSPLYAAQKLGCEWHAFLSDIVRILALSAAVALVGLALSHCVNLGTWPRLALAAALLTVLYFPAAWFAVLSHGERLQVKERFLTPTLARLAAIVR